KDRDRQRVFLRAGAGEVKVVRAEGLKGLHGRHPRRSARGEGTSKRLRRDVHGGTRLTRGIEALDEGLLEGGRGLRIPIQEKSLREPGLDHAGGGLAQDRQLAIA